LKISKRFGRNPNFWERYQRLAWANLKSMMAARLAYSEFKVAVTRYFISGYMTKFLDSTRLRE